MSILSVTLIGLTALGGLILITCMGSLLWVTTIKKNDNPKYVSRSYFYEYFKICGTQFVGKLDRYVAEYRKCETLLVVMW